MSVPLTTHAPLLGAGAALTGGRDLYDRQRAALAEAQRVPGVGSADDVRQAVGAYLAAMARDEIREVQSTLADLLALLDDAAATAQQRAIDHDHDEAIAHDWRTIALAIEGVRSQAEAVEARTP